MKLWPLKEDDAVRPLPALPGVIANAFQCNGCVRLPNFHLLIRPHVTWDKMGYSKKMTKYKQKVENNDKMYKIA